MENHIAYRHCMVVFNQYPLGETRVQREAEALIRSGCEVDVICKLLPGEQAKDSYKGVKIHRVKYHFGLPLVDRNGLGQRFLDYFRFFFSSFIRLTQLHIRAPFDSIQVHNLPDFLVFCTIIPKLLGTPVILDLHDLMPEFFAGRFSKSRSFLDRLIRWQERIACKYADHVITVSDHWREALIRRGVPATKCSVFMNVADSNIFHPSTSSSGYFHKRDGFRLIYHGTMVKRYGLDLAIQAVDKLREAIPGLHLSLIGQGEIVPELHQLVDQCNLKEYVSIQPKLLAEELPSIILDCDLGVVPYRNDIFTDGLLPTKLMEYAALGLPVVASRTTAIEAYFTGTNTEFFEPGNADDLADHILMLYQDPARVEQLRQGCKIFNDRYNWAEISAKYVSLVQALRSTHRSSTARQEIKS